MFLRQLPIKICTPLISVIYIPDGGGLSDIHLAAVFLGISR